MSPNLQSPFYLSVLTLAQFSGRLFKNGIIPAGGETQLIIRWSVFVCACFRQDGGGGRGVAKGICNCFLIKTTQPKFDENRYNFPKTETLPPEPNFSGPLDPGAEGADSFLPGPEVPREPN